MNPTPLKSMANKTRKPNLMAMIGSGKASHPAPSHTRFTPCPSLQKGKKKTGVRK
jgi:hypothetical protein